MTSLLLTLLLSCQAAPQKPPAKPADKEPLDVVYVKRSPQASETSEIKGQATLKDKEVEIVLPNGQTTRFPRPQVVRIEYAPNPITYPEQVEVDSSLLQPNVRYDYHSYGKVLVYVPQTAGHIVGIDITTGKPAWPAFQFPPKKQEGEYGFPQRLGDPKQFGSVLYLISKNEYDHPSKQITERGLAKPKFIQTITLMALEISTGNVLWKNEITNDAPYKKSRNPKDNYYWKTPPAKVPFLFDMEDRILLIIEKMGSPITKEGVVDPKKYIKYWTLYLHGAESGNLDKTADTTEKMLGIQKTPVIRREEIIFQRELARMKFEFVSISAKSGSTTWKSPPIAAKPVMIAGDDAYVSDGKNLFVHSIQAKGKRKPKWNFNHEHGTIPAIDDRFIYYYRGGRPPCGFSLTNPRTAQQTYLIELPPGDKFTYQRVSDNKLYYTDSKNVIHCFDTAEMKASWEWKSDDGGIISFFNLQGEVLTVLQAKDLIMIDATTGTTLWKSRADFIKGGAMPVGNAGFLGILPHGKTILIRQRADLPKGSRFFTGSGAPLCNIGLENVFSPPAFSKDRLYTFGQNGAAYVFDLKEKKQEPLQTLTMAQPSKWNPSEPVVLGEYVFYHATNAIKACNPEDITKVLNTIPDTVAPTPDRHTIPYGDGILTLTEGALVLTKLGSFEQKWKGPGGITTYTIVDDKAYALSSAEVFLVDLSVGAIQKRLKIQGRSNHVVSNGERTYTARGPYEVVESLEREFRSIYVSPNQDLAIQRHKFDGALAMAGTKVLFSSSDGKLVCLSGRSAAPPLWSFETPEYTSRLLVHGDRVWFAAVGKGLFGLNVEDGKVAWTEELRDAGLFTPILYDGKPAFWSSAGWMVVPSEGKAAPEGEKKAEGGAETKKDEAKPPEKK